MVMEVAAERIRGRGRRGESRRRILMLVVVSQMVLLVVWWRMAAAAAAAVGRRCCWAKRSFHILVGESFVLGSRRRQRDRRKGRLLKTVNVRGDRWDVDGG